MCWDGDRGLAVGRQTADAVLRHQTSQSRISLSCLLSLFPSLSLSLLSSLWSLLTWLQINSDTLATISWVVCDCSQTDSEIYWVLMWEPQNPTSCSEYHNYILWKVCATSYLTGINTVQQNSVSCLCLCVHFMSDCLEGIEQDVRKDSQIRFRRFVNPVQITVASFFSPRRTPLWNSSSEAITPRWRILDVITSICRLFYSHCEVTCRLPLTSPHNRQLQSSHQSLSAKNFDTQNLVEITSCDNLENSDLLMCMIDSYSLSLSFTVCGCPYQCFSALHFKTVKCTQYNFHKPFTYSAEHIHTGGVAFDLPFDTNTVSRVLT